ncbi:MAG: hypothetical protein M3Q07_02195 [Pseudobdellovibrionaceae bacterium]|nr:hypothetical protein [Pseudobdellovibrionaceae bacterium]
MKYIIALLFLTMQLDSYAGVDLQHRQRQISLLEEYERNYNLVRDRFYLGENGLVAQIDPWAKATVAWVENWDKIWLQVDKLKSPQRDSSLSQAIEILVRDQEYERNRLIKLAEEFTLQASRVRALLYSKTPPRSKGELYGEKIDKLITSNNSLSSHLTSIEKSILAKADRLKYISGFAYDKLDAYLTAAKLKTPDNAALVVKIRDILQQSKLVEPYVREVRRLAEDMRQDLSFGRIFHAKDRLSKLDVYVNKVKADIATLPGISSAAKDESLQRINNLYADAYAHMQDTASDPVQYPYMLAEYISTHAAPNMRYLCGTGSKSVNCGLAEWLNRIEISKVYAFPEYKLKALEYAWAAAQSGQPVDPRLKAEMEATR